MDEIKLNQIEAETLVLAEKALTNIEKRRNSFYEKILSLGMSFAFAETIWEEIVYFHLEGSNIETNEADNECIGMCDFCGT